LAVEGLGLFGRVEVVEERGVLREVRLELLKTNLEPVLEPVLAQLVFDSVEAAIAHDQIIGTEPGRRNEPFGLTSGRRGLYRQSRERHRRRRQALAELRALWLGARKRPGVWVSVDWRAVTARVLLVANNAYELPGALRVLVPQPPGG
jgi:hypothetical protein